MHGHARTVLGARTGADVRMHLPTVRMGLVGGGRCRDGTAARAPGPVISAPLPSYRSRERERVYFVGRSCERSCALIERLTRSVHIVNDDYPLECNVYRDLRR